MHCRNQLLFLVAILTVGLVVPSVPQSSPQTQDYYEVSDNANTLKVTCWGIGTYAEKLGSRFGKSKIITSPNGVYKAYTESEAILHNQGMRDWYCANNSRLFLSGLNGPEYQIVKTLSPLKGEYGNGIRLVEWSKDSRYLLLEEELWVYESHGFSPYPVVLDTTSGKFLKSDTFNLIYGTEDRGCSLFVETVGFDSPPHLLVKAIWYPYGTECDEREVLWRIDPIKNTGHPVETPE